MKTVGPELQRLCIPSRLHRRLSLALIGTGFLLARSAASTPLIQLGPTVYQTEHCLFIIDASVTWSSPSTAYDEIYGTGASAPYFPRLSGYFDTLTGLFPGNYFSICYIANTGASNVPNYIDRTYKATGISAGLGSAGLGTSGVPGTPQSFATVDFCRYNLPGGNVITPALGVYDHELGHAWGAQIFYTLNQPSLANGHWLPNSTVDCQLGGGLSTDGYVTVNKIHGDPEHGFRWQRVSNARSNDYSVFSEQTLYLMGLADLFPTSYVLNDPVYNSDQTMSFSSVDTFDHAAAVATYGVRNPDYKTSPKQFKLGFVYIARDVNEVNTVYQAVEQSAENFCNGEAINTTTFRSQTPFLTDSRYRASVDGLLSELDGNSRPVVTIDNPYVLSTDGTATVTFSASDPDGPAPAISVIPASTQAMVVGNSVQLSGLPGGVHFFTLKATDAGNKKMFAHFVVEVRFPVTALAIVTDPVSQTVIAGNVATLTAASSGGSSPLAYRWFVRSATTSTWNAMTNSGAYNGTDTSTLTINCTPAMDGDSFLCTISDSTGTATSQPAFLTIDETPPSITAEPADKSTTPATSTYFRVTAGNAATTFGYYDYQWQRQPAGSTIWSDLTASSTYSGVTQSQLTLYACTLAMDGDQFRCVVTNTTGPAVSSAATLDVGTAPTITLQPSAVSGSAGQTVLFSVSASGTGPLTYQWYKYATLVGNTATLTLSNVQPGDAGTYGVHVSNAFGVAYSTNVGLNVTAASPPGVSAPLQSVTANAGQDVALTIAATGSPPFSYQWRKNGANVTGATAATLALPAVTSADAGLYDVVITNSGGATTSNAITLTVDAAIVAPSNVVVTITVY
ncbi:MAG TPA: immunoglobulin domain-containing protein [Lacunisphaera sp.]|jgi:hypothetical protein